MTLLDPAAPFRLFYSQRHLLAELLRRNIAMRYQGSILGLAWSFAQPLMMLAVYTFVFGIVFKARWEVMGLENNDAAFPLILFCGMAMYQMFSDSLNSSGAIILGNASLVKKVIFPLALLPLATVLTAFIFGIAWFVPLFICAVFFLDSLSWTMLLLPVTLLSLFLLTAGLAFIVAAFGVYLRDIPQLVSVITQVLFFMTPIFYPVKFVPQSLRWIIEINPLAWMIEETRKLFLYRQQPDYLTCVLMLLGGWAVFQIGYACFDKMKKGFADVC